MKTIIELKSVYDYSEGEPERSLYESVVGYYSGFDEAVKQIETLVDGTDNYVMFLASEYVLDDISDESDVWSRWIKTRQYKRIGGEVVMTHETCKNYKGFIETLYTYKPGDIIEYIGYKDTVYTAIVGYTPPTVKEVEERGLVLDDTDDSYLVYELGEGDTHDHIPSTHIIGLVDATPDVFKQYKEKLKERYEVNGTKF